MEFTLAFGAVGDFIAVIELIKNIIVALDDCRGSARDYQDTVQNLEMLGKILQQVAEVYQDQGFNDHLGDLRAIAWRSLQQIRLCLDGFSDKIQKFAPSLTNGGTKNVFKDVARKIQWKLEEKDVDKFRTEVMGYTMSLNMLLEVTTVRVVQRNHEASIQQASEAETRTAVMIHDSNQSLKGYFGMIGRRILSRLDFVARLGMELKSSTSHLMSMMLAVSGELSSIRTVIMRLERPLNEEHFVFEDATGKVFPIHLRTITSWEAFEYVIVDRFKGKKGAHRTQRKRYSLQERASRREVDRSMDWESAFLPYQRVEMSLMCREAQNPALVRSSPTCPRCLTVSPGETGVEVQW
ncbi:vegetative cell wall protein gp1 [Colletotrichum tofieldiae]|nr:vegetative cell wall protein gp1 [Colletotrichum tofieldiae]GKT79829.1 vegetative cell wall protein gp1 [Colletotrichum tofieldiae]